MKKSCLLALLTSLGLLAGCASTSPSTEPAGEAAQLAGRDLMWAAGANEHCEVPPAISFGDDGRISGDAGCNRLIGQLKQDGKAVDFSQLGSTMRMCGPKLMEVEKKFMDNLAATRFVVKSGDDEVKCFDANGKLVMTLVPERLGACN